MSPDGIANLPPERGNVPRPRGRVPRHKAKDTSGSHSPDVKDITGSGEHKASSTSPEHDEPVEEPAEPAEEPTEPAEEPTEPAREPAKPVEEPTPILVLNYVQPIITKDTTVTELRRKIGHEKGKAWTTLLNDIADRIINLRNQHVVATELHATLRKDHRTSWDP